MSLRTKICYTNILHQVIKILFQIVLNVCVCDTVDVICVCLQHNYSVYLMNYWCSSLFSGVWSGVSDARVQLCGAWVSAGVWLCVVSSDGSLCGSNYGRRTEGLLQLRLSSQSWRASSEVWPPPPSCTPGLSSTATVSSHTWGMRCDLWPAADLLLCADDGFIERKNLDELLRQLMKTLKTVSEDECFSSYTLKMLG